MHGDAEGRPHGDRPAGGGGKAGLSPRACGGSMALSPLEFGISGFQKKGEKEKLKPPTLRIVCGGSPKKQIKAQLSPC